MLELIAPAPLPLVGPALVEPAADLELWLLPAENGIAALEGTDLYVIPVARYRLTATAAGRAALPAARVTVAGTERTARAVGWRSARSPARSRHRARSARSTARCRSGGWGRTRWS